MMMLPNSKPRVVGLRVPNATAECTHKPYRLTQDKISRLQSDGTLHQETFSRQTGAIRTPLLSVIFVLPQAYARDSKHIAPRLSTRLSPIRF